MKFFIAVLITALFFTSSLTEDKEYQKKDKHLKLYITNWDQYRIPKPVYVHVLKDVLNKIALFKRNVYCPFKQKTCNMSLSDIVKKIVNDSVKKFENGNKKSSEHSEESSEHSEETSNGNEKVSDDREETADDNSKNFENNDYEIATNGEIDQTTYEAEDGKLAERNQNDFHNIRDNDSTKTNSSTNNDVIINVYNIVQLNLLADEVDNETLDEAKETIKKLYGSYYGHLKVNKKHRGGYIKKLPFDPYLVKSG